MGKQVSPLGMMQDTQPCVLYTLSHAIRYRLQCLLALLTLLEFFQIQSNNVPSPTGWNS